jgi:hypothetical protein
MNLPEGVSEYSHGERLDKSDGTPNRNQRRGEVYDLAHGAATAEMLDEMQTMLRAIWERLR